MINPILHKLTAAVLASERLKALLPQDELAELLTAQATADRLIGAAAAVPMREVDVFALIDPKLRAGEVIDIEDFMMVLRDEITIRQARDYVIGALEKTPQRYETALIQLVNSHRAASYRGLSADLDSLLDEAAPVVAELDGISDAEAAFEADKMDAWAKLRDLTRVYHAIRTDHTSLLKSSDGEHFGSHQSALAFAWFGGIGEMWPDVDRVIRLGAYDGFFRVAAGEPFPVLDSSNPRHLAAVVRNRARLRPHVAQPDEAVEARTRHVLGSTSVPGPTVKDLGHESARYAGGEAASLRRRGIGTAPVRNPEVRRPLVTASKEQAVESLDD